MIEKNRNHWYVYKCLGCGVMSYANFFKRHRLGYEYVDKCRFKCSLMMPDGQCAYTKHQIVGILRSCIR